MLYDLRWALIVTLLATSVGCGPPPVPVGDCDLQAYVPHMTNGPLTTALGVLTCPQPETISLQVCLQEQTRGSWSDVPGCCASDSKTGERLRTETGTCRRTVGVYYRSSVTGTANGSVRTVVSDATASTSWTATTSAVASPSVNPISVSRSAKSSTRSSSTHASACSRRRIRSCCSRSGATWTGRLSVGPSMRCTPTARRGARPRCSRRCARWCPSTRRRAAMRRVQPAPERP